MWRGNVPYTNLSSAYDITNPYSNNGIYIYAGPGVVEGKQFTGLLCSVQLLA
jgi:hypothetical protein